MLLAQMWEQVYLETVGGATQLMPGCCGSWLQPNLAPIDYAWDFELHSRHIRKLQKAGEDWGRTGPKRVVTVEKEAIVWRKEA